MKKAMMATWSESEESFEEENEKEVENMCFMAIDDLDEGSKEDKWFLDSGCSRHMTGDESKFAFLTKRKGGYVTFGDNAKGRIIGQGLETSMGKLQIEDKRQQEESGEDPKKEKSPLALPPPQQVQGESSQDLPKDWKFVINHPQDQIIGNPSSGISLSVCIVSLNEHDGRTQFLPWTSNQQLNEGTFINQAKYIKDLLKRFNMEEAKVMKTPMSSSIKLDMDGKGKSIDSTMYRGMIGSLLYLTVSRPDIMYSGDNFELIGSRMPILPVVELKEIALVTLVIS
ncbi:Retrovirus-related Pol polyprotein from transposon RE2 [Vitis vinifera]|uniref:Retrovirus-related Pol polyprotein from transposon RE2 n=1 Tax=Vitis vinifera TaxID=29760 RepID=A0A438DKP4_VITVI|nr:Retrovirus-related Pol polyprotein from transposon RE2 [Vitis vinifera]